MLRRFSLLMFLVVLASAPCAKAAPPPGPTAQITVLPLLSGPVFAVSGTAAPYKLVITNTSKHPLRGVQVKLPELSYSGGYAEVIGPSFLKKVGSWWVWTTKLGPRSSKTLSFQVLVPPNAEQNDIFGYFVRVYDSMKLGVSTETWINSKWNG